MSPPGFQELAARLARLLNLKIRRGEISERRLARLAGFSQPHVHNVLRGERGMTPSTADRLLDALGLTVGDLLADERGALLLRPLAAAVPVLEGRLGGGRPFPLLPPEPVSVHFPFARVRELDEPAWASVAPDEQSMHPTIWPDDELLLDLGPAARSRPNFAGVYAIEWQGRGYLCRCQAVGDRLLTLVESAGPGAPPARLDLGLDGVEGVVRGRVAWVGRDLPGE